MDARIIDALARGDMAALRDCIGLEEYETACSPDDGRWITVGRIETTVILVTPSDMHAHGHDTLADAVTCYRDATSLVRTVKAHAEAATTLTRLERIANAHLN